MVKVVIMSVLEKAIKILSAAGDLENMVSNADKAEYNYDSELAHNRNDRFIKLVQSALGSHSAGGFLGGLGLAGLSAAGGLNFLDSSLNKKPRISKSVDQFTTGVNDFTNTVSNTVKNTIKNLPNASVRVVQDYSDAARTAVKDFVDGFKKGMDKSNYPWIFKADPKYDWSTSDYTKYWDHLKKTKYKSIV